MTPPRDLEIVVIGGSAGALEPLLALVGGLPESFAPPIAIVLHLAPRQPSLLGELLARTTSRPVYEPEDKQPLEPRAIYVAPPNYHLLIERTRTIALSVDDPVNFSRPSIDTLFESAADACGAATLGLVLSGSNDDGARGLAAIAAAGGVVAVQRPALAAYRTMPAAALARTPAATELSPEELASFLASFPSSFPASFPPRPELQP